MAARANTCAVECACRVCTGIRRSVDQIFQSLEVYGWILDSYIVDFFQEDLWQRLPGAWRNLLDQVSPEDLGKWILGETKSTRVWPLSLLALRKFIEIAEIPRNEKKASNLRCRSHAHEGVVPKRRSPCSDDDPLLNNLFTKHVKKKKRYEIDVISQIVSECAAESGCESVVDIGAGMGHLARFLAFKHDLRVTCVEQNHALIEAARKWDEQLVVSLEKSNRKFPSKKPEYICLQVVQGTNLAGELGVRGSGFGLVGLHPCGDLAASLLRLYAGEDTARFICIVGCCYMKMSLGSSPENGYPMSRYMKSSGDSSRLNYTALEVACHAVEKHCDKLKSNNYNDLIVHAYRAVLEYLLIEKNPSLRRSQLTNTKIKEDTTFQQYCEHATKCLKAEDRPTPVDYERPDVQSLLLQWKRILAFGSLRLMIAPLVETLVLFDRFLFLTELKLSACLKAEFDSRVSPRNILLVSAKPKTKET